MVIWEGAFFSTRLQYFICTCLENALESDPPSTTEVEKEFSYYGKLQSVWIARRPPGFAYVEFEDSRDARDAVKDLDGRLVFHLLLDTITVY